jgi:hypothetical protein
MEPKVAQLVCSSYEEACNEIFEHNTWNAAEEKEYNIQLKKLKNERNILKKWEYDNNLRKTLKEEIEEDKMFLGDTEDVITRLKIRENFLMLS